MKNGKFEAPRYTFFEDAIDNVSNSFNDTELILKKQYSYLIFTRLMYKIYTINTDFRENFHMLCRRFFIIGYVDPRDKIMHSISILSECSNKLLDKYASHSRHQSENLEQIAINIIRLSRISGIKFIDRFEKLENPNILPSREKDSLRMESERIHRLMSGENLPPNSKEPEEIQLYKIPKKNKNRPHEDKDILLSNFFIVEEILLDVVKEAIVIKNRNPHEDDGYIISTAFEIVISNSYRSYINDVDPNRCFIPKLPLYNPAIEKRSEYKSRVNNIIQDYICEMETTYKIDGFTSNPNFEYEDMRIEFLAIKITTGKSWDKALDYLSEKQIITPKRNTIIDEAKNLADYLDIRTSVRAKHTSSSPSRRKRRNKDQK